MNIDLSEDLLSALVLTLCVLCCARLRNSMPTKIFLSCCYLWNENNRAHREGLDTLSTINSRSGPVSHRTDWQGKKNEKTRSCPLHPHVVQNTEGRKFELCTGEKVQKVL